jgi:hypothetical protein
MLYVGLLGCGIEYCAVSVPVWYASKLGVYTVLYRVFSLKFCSFNYYALC